MATTKKPVRPTTLNVAPLDPFPVADLDIDSLLIDGVTVDAQIAAAIVGGEVTRTMEGASTLVITIHDQERDFVNSGIASRAARARIGGNDYLLVKVAKSGNEFTLTFEDRLVYFLRQKKGAKKAFRDRMTRAEFAWGLVREIKNPKILFYSPEVHKKQIVGGGSTPGAPTESPTAAQALAPGFKAGARLTVKGGTANGEQRKNAAIILSVAAGLRAPYLAILAMMETAIVESEIQMNRGAGSDAISYGVFQDTYGGTGPPGRRSNLAANTKLFLLGEEGNPNAAFHGGGAMTLARKHPDWSAGRISQAVQISNFPERYDQVKAEADRWIRAYNGSIADLPPEAGTTTTRTERYAFERKAGEGSWAALGRLAEEVKWRRFVVGRWLYFVAESDLIRSRARLRLSEDRSGVNWIDYDIDVGKPASSATVSARADLWEAPPGSVAEVVDSGPANGRWLVESVRRQLFSNDAEITLKKPEAQLPEPAPETTTTTTPGGGADPTTGATGVEGRLSGDTSGVVASMLKFGRLIAGQYGQTITINSGKRNGSGGSNHDWGGALDLGVGGLCSGGNSACRQGDAIATAALIVCGIDPATAKKRAESGWCDFTHNVKWEGHDVEIGWRTYTGGNHYHHVHVGFDR